jgi:hypothetical protein
MNETVEARLYETYKHLLIPSQEGTNPVEWKHASVQGDGLVKRAARKLIRDEELIIQWSPLTLRIELDNWLWKETPHLSTKKLWEYLASYLYLPRLRDRNVLVEAIRAGVADLAWQDFFAYAAAVDDKGHYAGLVTGEQPTIIFDDHSLLVKPDIALKQLAEVKASTPPGVTAQYLTGAKDIEPINEQGTPAETLPAKTILRRYYGSVTLNPQRVGLDASTIAEEVIAHLIGLDGAKGTITLEIDVEVPEGIPEDKVRIVSENSNTLKFNSSEFE